MTSLFSNKNSKIMVVDPSGPVRQLMADTIRATLGFESVEGRGSITDLLQYLEADKADWVVLSLAADQPANAMHFLKLSLDHPELKHMRVSLCLEEEERYVLPAAFELGLLSWHHKPFTKDSLGDEAKALLALLEGNSFNEPLTAAHYLRTYLKATTRHAAQVELEKSLLEVYPGNAQILLNLAEPLFHLGKKDEAKKTLAQVKVLDPKLAEKADETAKTVIGEPLGKADGEGDGGGVNVLGVGNAVVVESDEATARGVEDLLKQLGVKTVNRFADGEEAWKFLSTNPEPELLVLEWRIPKLSGPLLIQRVRQHGFLNLPIIVLSSLLKPEDMPLVREIGVANIVQKPLNRELFVPAVIWTMQQERLPTEQQALERRIRNLLKAGKSEEADPLRMMFMADKNVPLAKKRLIEAEHAFAMANYVLARDAAIESLKLAGDGILVLNILGKAFMRLMNHEAALKCFKKAQELSPNNIERLCNMAESSTEVGNHEAAATALDGAKSLDPDSKTVAEAEVKVAITKGDTEGAKKLFSAVDPNDGLVSYMNNKAVAYAKCGHAQDALDLYAKTLQSIPDNQPNTKAIVTYNMALAIIREGDLEIAVQKLDDVIKVKSSRVAKKAASLKERLKTAIKKGTDFRLNAAEGADAAKAPGAPGEAAKTATPAAPALSTDEDNRRQLAMIEAKRGDLCCYLIFSNPDPADARVTSLLAKPPKFQRRDSIERDEAHGVEKTAKSA